MRKQNRKKEKTLELFGWLSLGTGVFINVCLPLILTLSGICEHPPIILYVFGFFFLLLAMGILNVWLPKVYRESKSVTPSSFCEVEDLIDPRIVMEIDLLLARRADSELENKLNSNTRIDEEFPIVLDTFGYEPPNPSYVCSNRHLLITKDAPPNSIQALSNFLDFKNVRLLKRERIDYLIIVGGEVLDNVDDLVRIIGGIRKCMRQFYPTKILICTSTTNLEALKTISLLGDFIDGFMYVPYNESSLRTLIKFTKFLNKRKIKLLKNMLFLLPEMNNLIKSVKGLDFNVNWTLSTLKDRRELEQWKGHNLRTLNN